MNLLLIQSYLGTNEPLVYPLGISCLAACLDRHKVKLIDTNLSRPPFKELVQAVQAFKPDVVGISLRNIDSTNKRIVKVYYGYLSAIIDAIENFLPIQCRIIAGGPGFSMFAESIMAKEPRITMGVFTEAEKTLPELMDHLEEPECVPGVFYRKNNNILFSGHREPSDLGCLPPPERTLLDPGAYAGVLDAIGVETKRGCAFHCIYCIYGFLNGRAYRLRDPQQVANDIENITKAGNIKRFTFTDSVFNFPLDHAKAICKALIKRRLNISWSAWFHESFLDEEMLQLAREAGCKAMIFSPDGFSRTTLKALGKLQTPEDLSRVWDMVRHFKDMEISYNFFKNPPGQTLASVIRLLGFYIKAKRMLGKRVHFEFSSIRIEPHTRLHDLALKEGLVSETDDLLDPVYYKNRKTWYIDLFFNLMLRLKGK